MKHENILDVQERLRERAESRGIPETEMGVLVGGSDFYSPLDGTIQIEAHDLFAMGPVEEIRAIIDGAGSVDDIVAECRSRNLSRCG